MENKDKIESRRSFLKKAAYAVPTIVALGQITNPVPAAAGTGFVICPNATIVGTAYAAFLRKLLLDSILSLFSIL